MAMKSTSADAASPVFLLRSRVQGFALCRIRQTQRLRSKAALKPAGCYAAAPAIPFRLRTGRNRKTPIGSKHRVRIQTATPEQASRGASPPAKQTFDIPELQHDVRRPAVVALPGIGRHLHLPKESVHVVGRKFLAGPY